MVMNLPAVQSTRVWSLSWEDHWRKEWQPSPIFLPGEFHGQRSLVGYRPWGCKELDTTEWLTLSLFIIQRSPKWNKTNKQTKKNNKKQQQKPPHHLLTLRHTKWDFPGGPVVKSLPASAESMGSIPDLGRFHMLWSNQAHVSQLLKLLHPTVCLCSKRSPCTATREQPPLATSRESLQAAVKTQHSQN